MSTFTPMYGNMTTLKDGKKKDTAQQSTKTVVGGGETPDSVIKDDPNSLKNQNAALVGADCQK